jgi:hypothetical protein
MPTGAYHRQAQQLEAEQQCRRVIGTRERQRAERTDAEQQVTVPRDVPR